MTTAMTNFMQINETDVKGNIATLTFDIDVTGLAHESDNEKAPVYKLFAQTPRGRMIEIGGIWERVNQKGKPYYSLTIDTGHSRFYANLGRYPGQDDETIFAVIANDYLNANEGRG